MTRKNSTGEFPHKFVSNPEILRGGLGLLGDEALKKLNAKGYEVADGLSSDYAAAISIMAQQPHIVEYCPKDTTSSRFAGRASTEKWLQKAGGRAVFLLLEKLESEDQDLNLRLAGYGWTGYEITPTYEEYPVTSAYRLGMNHLGKGLASAFTQVVISATYHLYSKESLGLETWLSNKAVHIYNQLGFFALASIDELEEEWRPTLQPDVPNGLILDKRLHMGYPDSKLA